MLLQIASPTVIKYKHQRGFISRMSSSRAERS